VDQRGIAFRFDFGLEVLAPAVRRELGHVGLVRDAQHHVPQVSARVNSGALGRHDEAQEHDRSVAAALGLEEEHRVDRGDCSPRPPTDPDVQIPRIRLLGVEVRYVEPTNRRMRVRGSGKSWRSALKRAHETRPRCDRLESQLRQISPVRKRTDSIARAFPVTA